MPAIRKQVTRTAPAAQSTPRSPGRCSWKTSRAVNVSSGTAIAAASDVSLNREINVLLKDGKTVRNMMGIVTYRATPNRLSRATARRRDNACQPPGYRARKISDRYAPA